MTDPRPTTGAEVQQLLALAAGDTPALSYQAHNLIVAVVGFYGQLVVQQKRHIERLVGENAMLRAKLSRASDDRSNEDRLPGQERERKEPVEAGPEQGVGAGTTRAGREIQTHRQMGEEVREDAQPGMNPTRCNFLTGDGIRCDLVAHHDGSHFSYE